MFSSCWLASERWGASECWLRSHLEGASNLDSAGTGPVSYLWHSHMLNAMSTMAVKKCRHLSKCSKAEYLGNSGHLLFGQLPRYHKTLWGVCAAIDSPTCIATAKTTGRIEFLYCYAILAETQVSTDLEPSVTPCRATTPLTWGICEDSHIWCLRCGVDAHHATAITITAKTGC